jgi:hypothetical protein
VRERPFSLALIGLAALVTSSIARADFPARLDHAGALGISADVGYEFCPTLTSSQVDTSRLTLAVSPSWGLSSGNELVLTAGLVASPFLPKTQNGTYATPSGRAILDDHAWGASLAGMYRLMRGRDEWKSFLDLGVRADTAPEPVIGPAVNIGLQYEVSPVLGVYLKLGSSLELGGTLRAGFSIALGVQGRTYLLDTPPPT